MQGWCWLFLIKNKSLVDQKWLGEEKIRKQDKAIKRLNQKKSIEAMEKIKNTRR